MAHITIFSIYGKPEISTRFSKLSVIDLVEKTTPIIYLLTLIGGYNDFKEFLENRNYFRLQSFVNSNYHTKY